MAVEMRPKVGDPSTHGKTRAESRRNFLSPIGPHAVASDVEFWATHIRIGFALLAVESFAVMVYLLLTPNGSARPLLWGVSLVCAASGVIVVRLAQKVAGRPWRGTFSFVWTMGSGAAVTLLAILDHGSDSPLLVLLWLPIVYAALALDLRQTPLCGVAGLAELGLIVVVDLVVASNRITTRPGALFMIGAGIIGGVILALAASMNRTRLQLRDQELTEKLAELATIDSLTGCLNRRAFSDRLNEEIERACRYGQPFALVVVDIDNFKAINDEHGHLRGDAVLIQVAEAAKAETRAPDFVARLGGDEFAIAFPQVSFAGAALSAERLHLRLSRSAESPTNICIGITSLDLTRPTQECLLADADEALYFAKRSGRAAIAMKKPGGGPPVRIFGSRRHDPQVLAAD